MERRVVGIGTMVEGTTPAAEHAIGRVRSLQWGVTAGGEKVMKRGLVKRVERLERVQPRDEFDLHFSLGNRSPSACQEGAAIDLVELERLCMLHCTDQEIASYFGVTPERIEQERQSPRFAEVMERGRAKGKIAIRRGQMRLLEKGSSTMGVLLGRQILGQQDEVDAPKPPTVIVLPSVRPIKEEEEQLMATPDELRNRPRW